MQERMEQLFVYVIINLMENYMQAIKDKIYLFIIALIILIIINIFFIFIKIFKNEFIRLN